MRNASFSNPQWQPKGPTLALRKDSVMGPFSFMNPTTALYDVKSNDLPGGRTEDLGDFTDPEGQNRAKVQWNARDYRKGRHVLILPRHSPLAARLHKKQHHKVLLGIGRMFTLFPYWDVSWLIGICFTIGCLIFVACGLFYFLPIADPSSKFEGEGLAGGLTSFIGATLFQIGAVMLFLESYNDRAETKFGGAMESVFVDRLHIGHRRENTRVRHYEVGKDEEAPEQGDHITPAQTLSHTISHQSNHKESSAGKENKLEKISSEGDSSTDASHQKKKKHEAGSHPDDDGVVPDDDAEMFGSFEERSWQWLPSWYDFKTHYIYEIGFLASLTMSIGATIFYISGIMAIPQIFDTLSEGVLKGVYYLAYLVGGLLFVLASALYCLENQATWYKPNLHRIGWHIGFWNLVGGIGWTLAAAFGGYCEQDWAEYQSQLCLTWASAAFAFGSGLQWYECLDKYIVVIQD